MNQTVRVFGCELLRMLSPIQMNAFFFPATGTTSIVWVMKVLAEFSPCAIFPLACHGPQRFVAVW
jgi:hypothetical protein